MLELEISANDNVCMGVDDTSAAFCVGIDGTVAAFEVKDYNLLENKPTINGRTLESGFTLGALDVGAVPIVDKLTNSQIEQIIGGI